VPTPEMARNTRRAAALFHAWDRDDNAAICALMAEAEQDDEALTDIVCGLLYVGANLANAAADGHYDDYLEQLRGASLLAEIETERTTDHG
jgi:hypothetical protein